MTKSQQLIRRVLANDATLPTEPVHPGIYGAAELSSLVFRNLCLLADRTGFKIEAHTYSGLNGLPFCLTEIAFSLGELQFALDYAALDFGFPANTQERKRVIEWLRNEAIVRRHRTPAHMENKRVEGHLETLERHAIALANALGPSIDLFHNCSCPRRTLAELKSAFESFQRALDTVATLCGLDLERIISTLSALKLRETPYDHTDLLPAIS